MIDRLGAISSGVLLVLLGGCAGSDPSAETGPSTSTRRESVMSESDASIATRMIDDWRWHHRLLVVRSRTDGMLARQATLVAGQEAGWNDRELRLVLLTTDGGLVVDRFVDGGPVGETFASGVEREFIERYGVEVDGNGVSAALAGKDGGVKARWSEVVEPSAVFDLVDAMPMRLREMKESEE